MASVPSVAAAASSTLLRIASFLFLRWIPGHVFPPVVFTSLVVYVSSLLSLGRHADQRAPDQRKKAQRTKPEKFLPQPGVFKTLLTGLPSATAPRSTRLTVLLNIVLSLLTLDFLFRGVAFYGGQDVAFSRIGYVSPSTASLLVREPDPVQLPLIVYYQEAAVQDPSKWIEEGTIYSLDDSTDFTATVTLKGLKPSSQYRYRLSNNRTGSFATAPQSGSKEANHVSFLTSSCMKPNFPYNPLEHPLRIYGIETMTKTIQQLPSWLRPTFMLFLGDFIYIDVPQRFGSSISHYRSEYRRVYSSPSWNMPQDNPPIDLPWYHTLDDHEIENDWSKGNTTAPFPSAVDPFIHYHVSANPPRPSKPFAKPEETTYFAFTHGPASFFMLDTRTYRSEPAHPNSTILGSAQLHSLLTYLAQPEPPSVRWKIISSSVPFTKNWHVGTTDTWGGFLHERRAVFEAMWRAERDLGVRVVLLSGDRHEFGATRFPDPALGLEDSDTRPDTPGDGVHEFSVGPLSMFYLPVRTYRQTDSEDVTVKYIPDGNVKYGLIDIDVRDEPVAGDDRMSVPSSVLTYSLYVEDAVVWKYSLSVPLQGHETAVAASKTKHPRLPPGRVLVDNVPGVGWNAYMKEAVGQVEEVIGVIRDKLVEQYYEFLEQKGEAAVE